ncbi:serine hydrolase [uncultured Massilia sp.]|uniref:serine hydrolase domain-containing protein n=1 Tax=uncultured Massilia sp. TaxID=169973 RepID=UPI0025D5209F|nr:serine hydrolase domain-containing protein [uncultured Massilia sp.]
MKARLPTKFLSGAALLCAALALPSFAADPKQAPTEPAPVPALARTPQDKAGAALKERLPENPLPAAPRAPVSDGATDGATDGTTHALDAADLGAWLDGRVPYALKSGDIGGMVISVVKDGKVLLQKGYGLADVAARVSMDPADTLVRIGSTSKLFTWTAVMQLVQQGKIDLDRNVNDYLDFKIAEPYGKPVTMRHLMNHRAGFEEGLKDLLSYDPQRTPSTERYLKDHPRPMLFAPGAVPAYSNYGVALAGYIVQRLSGEPFEAYVERHIFRPLGMTHTTFVQPLPANFPGTLSKGYRSASEPPSEFEMVVTAPAGSVTTTAADMARFMLAHLQQGSLDGYAMLDPATTARMHGATESAPEGFARMAHGFFLATQNGRTVLGHGGDTVVFHTELGLLPQEGVGIFFTFNSRGKDAATYGARKELFDGFMDRYFPGAASAADTAPALATAKEDAHRIAGRYEGSRRVEHGFLSVLYLLDQTVIAATPDGTIKVPDPVVGGLVEYREVAPQRWRKIGGAQTLMLTEVDGVKTVVDSENPVSVLQEASFLRSTSLNLTVLSLSVLVLLATLVMWPLGALLRRADRAVSGASPELRRLRRVQRVAVAVAMAWLFVWFLLIQPVLVTDLRLYSYANDWLVGLVEASGLLAVAAAVAGVWAAWRMRRADASALARTWSVLVALALLGLLWVGAVGQLLAWNLNY